MIEVRTVFDSSITLPLIKFQLRKIRVFMLVFVGLMIVLGLVLCFVSDLQSTGFFMVIFGVLYYPCVYSLSKLIQKNVNKTTKIMSVETQNNFTFADDRFFQETVRGTEFRGVTDMAYTMLHKAFETQSHYFLYISNMQTHVIPKKDITTGTAAELTALLSARLGSRYKYVNTK